jgi:hypothetical protein
MVVLHSLSIFNGSAQESNVRLVQPHSILLIPIAQDKMLVANLMEDSSSGKSNTPAHCSDSEILVLESLATANQFSILMWKRKSPRVEQAIRILVCKFVCVSNLGIHTQHTT